MGGVNLFLNTWQIFAVCFLLFVILITVWVVFYQSRKALVLTDKGFYFSKALLPYYMYPCGYLRWENIRAMQYEAKRHWWQTNILLITYPHEALLPVLPKKNDPAERIFNNDNLIQACLLIGNLKNGDGVAQELMNKWQAKCPDYQNLSLPPPPTWKDYISKSFCVAMLGLIIIGFAIIIYLHN
ncbi:hypothetical protein [Suttonella ornithocola]|uniref:Uncharacterized protein n=1 Tax=Suttonella ornithocola TaxID=279832 RepID=A0A380MYC0_9GAMM|nr:hypothetical protein [Suttonella ornithocola]SUO97016.1 Uncharacterised protein [Suttonella ornithocola]